MTPQLVDLFESLLAEALLKSYAAALHTVADNGKEFSYHERITKELGVPVYFVHPYHSWERGLNENTKGLLHQY